ncbi:ATP-binding protein [Bacillus sp. BGMRC 2118]|nr:ATP-binding protein [Bacillus sp. BGMRC 2118]
MKRLVIITVGKTHSGKTTFARLLENELENSFVMDQDNHADFINNYYKKIEPKQGPNTLKHSISKLIVTYAKEQTDLHTIICNSNRTWKDREYLLKELYPQDQFTRILVHFDIPDAVLEARVKESNRSTTIFRGVTTFEKVLRCQQKETVDDPVEGEADYLFTIRNDEEVGKVIKEITKLV